MRCRRGSAPFVLPLLMLSEDTCGAPAHIKISAKSVAADVITGSQRVAGERRESGVTAEGNEREREREVEFDLPRRASERL